MSMPSLLVIDDDNALLYSIRKTLETENLRVLLANSAADGIALFESEHPTAVLLDLRLHEVSGLDVLREIRKIDAAVPVIMFTAFSTTAATIEASKEGAFEYLLKPVDLKKLVAVVDKAISSRALSATKPATLIEPLPKFDAIMVGSSETMQNVYKQIGRFSTANANVLILGESGTGKELAAQAIHRHSPRRSNQFIAINCAALSETLLESELFGHERGAFTGADRRRIGKFEYANGGTIFLDEVADMSPTTQAKVLRLLQERCFERLGSNETIETNVRILAATNKNLEAMVSQGKFREDLYYRLNVFCIRLPALRDRLSDLPELVSYFINSYKNEFGKERVLIEPQIFPLLQRHRWPGNMRELQNVVKHALAHAADTIRVEHLPQHLVNNIARPGAMACDDLSALQELTQRLLANGDRNVYEKTVGYLDQIVLRTVLVHTKGNMQQACDYLGISRNTLKAKMREQGISIEPSILSKNDNLAQILNSSEAVAP